MTPQIYSLVASVRRFFGRHHAIIFIVIVSLLFAVAIFTLYQIFIIAATPTTNGNSTIGGFNQKTIDQIKELHDSSNANTTITLPSPRPNPFVE